jgi:hypothetical protein
MADEVDIANDRAQQLLDAQIAAVRAKQRTEAPELCVECEEPNLPARRELGLSLCLECAQLRERLARLFA